VKALRVVALPLGLALLCATASSGEKSRYTSSPEEYARQFDAMIAARDRAEDHRLKRDPGPRMLGAEQVPAMLLLLKSEHWQAREFACHVLGRRRAVAALEVLIARLGDEHERVRERAAEALGRIRDKRAVDPLLKRLDHPAEKRGKRGTNARGHMALALGRLGEKRAVRPLIAALEDQNLHVRRSAAAALGSLGDPAAVPALLPLLKERHGDLVRAAVEALGRLKAAAAVDGILPLLGHKDRRLRRASAEALGNIGDGRARASLERLLAGDKDRDARAAAARALGKLGQRAAIPALRAALKDKHHDVGAWAAKSLYDLKDPEGLKALLDLFAKRQENQNHHPVCNALGEMGRAAVPIVLEGLADPKNRRLRENCALAVRYVGEPCLDGVIKLLSHPNPGVRMAACRALYYYPHKRGTAPLLAVLRDPKSRAQRQAADALARRGGAVVPELIAVSRSGKTDLRPVIDAMGRIRDARLVPVLMGMTKHKEPSIRESAAGALANQPHPDALPAVVALLCDREAKVRGKVLDILGKRPWARKYAPQVTPLLKDESVHVRRRAATALRAFGQPVAIPALQARLREEKDKHTVRAMESAITEINKSEERRKREEKKRAERERKRKEQEAERKRREEEARKRREKDGDKRAEEERKRKEQERKERERKENERKKREEEERRKKQDQEGDEEPV
jgi:HEAT repeat protein